jgi:hypothetical protein
MPIMFSRKECNQKGRSIENDIRKRFGWNVTVTVRQDGAWSWKPRGKNADRYDLYPGMSKADADAAVMREVVSIVGKYIPGAVLSDYYQSGGWHYPNQR